MPIRLEPMRQQPLRASRALWEATDGVGLSGADALIVFNHGGRQLDGAKSSIRTLPRIVDAVGRRIEVHMDGGIMSGQDVLKARALGARSVYIGRAFLYGPGAMGEAGQSAADHLMELDITISFCRHTDIDQVDSGIASASGPTC